MPNWRLTLDLSTDGQREAERLSLIVADGERCIIGRGKHVQIVCDTHACSREHCAITVIEGQAWLEDLGSSNGTWLNGQKVGRSKLVVGDKIAAGHPTLRILAIEPADPI